MFRYIETLRMASRAAVLAHKNQFRKNKITPYIVHPASVSQMVLMYDPACYLGAITAWFHDVKEDCGKPEIDLMNTALFESPLSGDEIMQVSNAVDALTKNDNITPRLAKWEDCITRLLSDDAPPFTVLVKICDRIDNLMDMEGFAPGFEKIYIEETDMMIRAIERRLLDRYEQAAFNDLKRLRDYIVERDDITVLANL